MSYAIVLNDENFFYADVLERLLEDNNLKLKKVYIVNAFTSQRQKYQYLYKAIPVAGMRFMIGYLADELKRRWQNKTIRGLCKHNNLECHFIKNVNSKEFSRDLKKNAITTLLSFSSQIYKKKIIDQLPIYNFHPSLLPKYKGRFPIFWALYENEKYMGVTCHRVRERIDGGEIMLQKTLPIERDDNFKSLTYKLLSMTPSFVAEFIQVLETQAKPISTISKGSYGHAPSTKQLAKYWFKMKVKDIRKFTSAR